MFLYLGVVKDYNLDPSDILPTVRYIGVEEDWIPDPTDILPRFRNIGVGRGLDPRSYRYIT